MMLFGFSDINCDFFWNSVFTEVNYNNNNSNSFTSSMLSFFYWKKLLLIWFTDNKPLYLDLPKMFWRKLFSCRFVNRLFVAMKEFQNHMSEVACPLFILHGDKDAVCELGGAQMMHEKASSTDKTLKVTFRKLLLVINYSKQQYLWCYVYKSTTCIRHVGNKNNAISHIII